MNKRIILREIVREVEIRDDQEPEQEVKVEPDSPPRRWNPFRMFVDFFNWLNQLS